MFMVKIDPVYAHEHGLPATLKASHVETVGGAPVLYHPENHQCYLIVHPGAWRIAYREGLTA
jgi:hypothetical protein